VEWWLGYAAVGAVVGFFAGMLGIGGGAIMVPLLVWFFEAQGLPKAHILHLAVGTAMATILFTSVASVRAHAARGAIRWDIARNVTPGILAGGLVGSWIASFIPPVLFAALFHRGRLRRRDQSPARPQSQAFASAAGLRGNVRFRFPGERALSVRGDRRRVHDRPLHALVQRAGAPGDRHGGGDRLSDRALGTIGSSPPACAKRASRPTAWDSSIYQGWLESLQRAC